MARRRFRHIHEKRHQENLDMNAQTELKHFGLEIRIVKSGRCGVAKPTEEFWAAWRTEKMALKEKGYRVGRNGPGWEVEVPLHLIDESTARPTVAVNEASDESVMPDHLEKGLFSPSAATDLRNESPDDYDRRRDFEEDGDGEYYPTHGHIRGFGGR